MGKSDTDTCTLTLPLIVEKWQSDRLEKRLEIARQIYNALVRKELAKLRQLENTNEYRTALAELCALPNSAEAERDVIYKKLNELRKNAKLTEYAFKDDIKPFYKHFKENIGSNVAAHGIAPDVWSAFDRYFHGNGKTIHFKRTGELRSVRGFSKSFNKSSPNASLSGGKEIMYKGDYIAWNGLRLKIKRDPLNEYEQEMLEYRIKYCRIIKRPGKNKPRWYVQLSLEGKPIVKFDRKTGEVRHPVGEGMVGIDIGPQTIAFVSERESDLRELAPGVKNLEREQRKLLRKLDRSRRAVNPDNYAPDGTIKKGVKLTWVKSNRYQKTQRELSFIQSQQAALRKRLHNELANHLLSLGDTFYVEDMNWPALAHRAQKTEISEKTGKYKRKKRFGKSIGNKAPATLTTMLDLKLKSRGAPGLIKIPPASLKASQFNHITGEYHEKGLKERWNIMPDGRTVQRDLYSAFLLRHVSPTIELTTPRKTGRKKRNNPHIAYEYDLEKLNLDYPRFLVQHDVIIKKLEQQKNTITSMGIRRRAS